MRQVHMAKDSVEAHMVKGLLEARDITAMVVGHLKMPLPLFGLQLSIMILEGTPWKASKAC